MIGIAFFTKAGVPQDGLTVTWASCREVVTTAVRGDAPAWTEVGDGVYKTADYNPGVTCAGFADGSATLDDAERYVPVTWIDIEGSQVEDWLKLIRAIFQGDVVRTDVAGVGRVYEFKNVDGITVATHTITSTGRTTS